eukprot:8214713-Pyramimonas_sp.AAC.1
MSFYVVLELVYRKAAILRDTDKLRKHLLTHRERLKTDGSYPTLPDISAYDVQKWHEAANICVDLYGRQPRMGYHAPALSGYDDAALLPEGAGTRPHRVAVRMRAIAVSLQEHRHILDNSALLTIECTKSLLQTDCDWVPYQGQVMLKRYLRARHGDRYEGHHASTVPYMELPGDG